MGVNKMEAKERNWAKELLLTAGLVGAIVLATAVAVDLLTYA